MRNSIHSEPADPDSTNQMRCAASESSVTSALSIRERNSFLVRQNRQLQDTVQRLSRLVYIDSLTGLPNRRYFESVLDTAVRKVRRHGTSLTLAMCDIDHFKRINDNFGHQCGDAVLRVVGSAIAKHCRRPGDVAARYGGEEFALILPDLQASATLQLLERLRRNIADVSAQAQHIVKDQTITISIGVTTVDPSRLASPACVVRAADIALYRAKEAGRNRIKYRSIND